MAKVDATWLKEDAGEVDSDELRHKLRQARVRIAAANALRTKQTSSSRQRKHLIRKTEEYAQKRHELRLQPRRETSTKGLQVRVKRQPSARVSVNGLKKPRLIQVAPSATAAAATDETPGSICAPVPADPSAERLGPGRAIYQHDQAQEEQKEGTGKEEEKEDLEVEDLEVEELPEADPPSRRAHGGAKLAYHATDAAEQRRQWLTGTGGTDSALLAAQQQAKAQRDSQDNQDNQHKAAEDQWEENERRRRARAAREKFVEERFGSFVERDNPWDVRMKRLLEGWLGCVRGAKGWVLSWPVVVKWRIKHGYVVYGVDRRADEHREDWDALMLREHDLGLLLQVYDKIDADCSGEISINELLTYLEMAKTPFSQAIFSVMDEDGSGELDFREFAIAVWNYGTLSKATLSMFAFDMYDRDHSGILDAHEVLHLLRDVYGSMQAVQDNPQAQQIVRALNAMSKPHLRVGNTAEINVEQFTEFCRHNPGLLYPAFQMQRRLQSKVVGEAFWARKARTRVYLSDGSFINVAKLLNMHVQQHQFQRLAELEEFDRKQEVTADVAPIKTALLRTGILNIRRFFRGFQGHEGSALPDSDARKARQAKIERSRTKLALATRDFHLNYLLMAGHSRDEAEDKSSWGDGSLEHAEAAAIKRRDRHLPPSMRDSYGGLEKGRKMWDGY